MTLSEMLAMPTGYTPEDWEKELKRWRRLDGQINTLSDKIQECDDALDVLSDEVGSERWHKWDDERTKLRIKLERIKEFRSKSIYRREKAPMDRLTKWNGQKYILPQGRTADGQSYWRIIADRLAAYENTGLTPEDIEQMKSRY